MRAKNAYDVRVTRSGWLPASLADPDRVDHIEVLDIASGEVAFFWDLAPRDATKLARSLRRDLLRLEPTGFLAKWQEFQV